MDQLVIHHPLEDLTQTDIGHNKSVVRGIRSILSKVRNWNHRSLPPRWGDVCGGPYVIEKFKENIQAGFKKVPQKLIVHTSGPAADSLD
ncbi:hypothetical protein PoB_006036000 [Plakobranchus ocellatus]|uniref:Macro domain-containing protein n=1 Tax=Plakobranchus ocellatus TaxID=259542 RepID=A0AAV4CPN3_9GAST|nr:hypothetical protein PoB_006036000 [Plakobranchus ocellatus]